MDSPFSMKGGYQSMKDTWVARTTLYNSENGAVEGEK